MPTDEQQALWAVIRDDPDADTPRLVYADWLDDHGDPARAEFIRLQCHLAAAPRFTMNDVPMREVKQRERRLVNEHGWAWTAAALAPLAGRPVYAGYTTPTRAGPGQHFRRGFLHKLGLTADAAAGLAGAGNEVEPVQEVRVLDFGHGRHAELADTVGVVARSAFSAAVVALHIYDADDEVVRRLVDGGRWGRLQEVVLSRGPLGDDGAAVLSGSPVLAGVETALLYENRIGDAGAAALAASPHLDGLRLLSVVGNPIGPAGRDRLRERFGAAVQFEW